MTGQQRHAVGSISALEWKTETRATTTTTTKRKVRRRRRRRTRKRKRGGATLTVGPPRRVSAKRSVANSLSLSTIARRWSILHAIQFFPGSRRCLVRRMRISKFAEDRERNSRGAKRGVERGTGSRWGGFHRATVCKPAAAAAVATHVLGNI